MPQVAARVLELVNEARAKPRKCGSRAFPPVPPLTLSPILSRAALAHAKDMSAHKLFEHRGSDGSMPADRALRAGYNWMAVGENIAEGAATAEIVVQGWLDSPGHCVNIMGAQYREMGLAYFTDFAHKGDIYWAQTFGTAEEESRGGSIPALPRRTACRRAGDYSVRVSSFFELDARCSRCRRQRRPRRHCGAKRKRCPKRSRSRHP